MSTISILALILNVGLPGVPTESVAKRHVEISLRGGARIEATILKESETHLYADLGFDVLAIPVVEILARKDLDPKTATPSETTSSTSEWTTRNETVERSVREWADILGSSVVLVATPGGTGSGFFVNDQGLVVTNCHVIERERKITLTAFQKRANGYEKKKLTKIRIVAINAYHDLALLQVDPSELKELDFSIAPLAKEANLRAGESVFAIGNPRGLERTVTEGIVSTANRNMDGQLYLQTTTQINPGNSGGPLFNLRGEVIGVTNMILLQSEGLGFAIPVRRVKEFLENREAFAFDADQPNTGHRYLPPLEQPTPSK